MTTPDQTVREAPPRAESDSRTDDVNVSRPTPPMTVVVKRSVLGASSRLGVLRAASATARGASGGS